MSGVVGGEHKDGKGGKGMEHLQRLIAQWVDNHRDKMLEWNRELVAIPSVNRCSDGDEAQVQGRISERLLSLGCEVDCFLPTEVEGIEAHPAYLAGRNYVNRPNVVGRKAGRKADRKADGHASAAPGRSLMFSGHIDTVPLAGGTWSVDPFSGIVRDGRQYGLGLFDMKGGMAAALAAMEALQDLHIHLAGDVWLESVVDEEFGGANGTLACRLKGYEADLTIIPEPTNLAICPASQGGVMYRIVYTGDAGRGFSGEKLISPVFAGARFLEWFRKYQEHHASKASTSRWYEDGVLPAYIQGIQAGDPSLPLYDRSPQSCQIDVWIQCYPGTTEADIYRDFMAFYGQHARTDELLATAPMKMERLIRFLPGMEIKQSDEVIPVLQIAAAHCFTEELPVLGAPFACDAFMFDQYGSSNIIVCGPKGGNAHAADEYIEVESFYKLVEFYALTMIAWCGVESAGE